MRVHNRSGEPIRLIYSRAEVRSGSVFAAVPREAIEPGGSVEVPIRQAEELGSGQESRGYVRIQIELARAVRAESAGSRATVAPWVE